MRFLLHPGNAIACKINTHKSQWDGSICKDPESWNCSAPDHFRESYCARGDDRCFHVHTFDAAGPNMVIEENGAGWLLETAPDALNDQLLVFWGGRGTPPFGIPDRDRRDVLFGVYRVKTVEREDMGHRTQWRVVPHDDAWVCLAAMNLARPRYEELGGMYLKQMDGDELRALFADERMLRLLDGGDQVRFRNFARHVGEWLEVAAQRTAALHERLGTKPYTGRGMEPEPVRVPPPLSSKPFRGLGELVKPVESRPNAPVATATAAPPRTAPPAKASVEVLTPEVAARIEATHGEDLLLDLRIALATRDLVVLRGEPGVGKSHLALRLLDDPERERTLVVPVSATWRGREDLLGYVNPMDGRFVKTPFTRFLEFAANAWREGDRAPRLVIFEEFNLSQPEHWFADVLAVSQYDDEADRIVQLAGTGAKDDANVFLSPALRFIATVNNDHTTRALSPRVLDRAAVVHLELTPKQALARIGLDLEAPLVNAISGLDFRLRSRGASFSIRTARSLQACLQLGLVARAGAALDLVLAQQVLSKVRLAAHDPADLRVLEDLEQWCEEQQAGLQRCVAVISSWREALDAGLDVAQA
ncbi:MAG: AAA family ATPase [Planctomycetes bacterium]|nr:AAA family ATPase [Planctomycetota bacterium]